MRAYNLLQLNKKKQQKICLYEILFFTLHLQINTNLFRYCLILRQKIMGKERDAKKETKKEPTKTLKEKRLEKKEKKNKK